MSIATTSASTPRSSPAYCYVGATVLRGRITPEQMDAAANLAERYATANCAPPTCRISLIVNVPQLHAEELAKELERSISPWAARRSRADRRLQWHRVLQTCHHGNQSFSRWLVKELEDRLPGFDQHLKLHVTGCPNSCGQHWIADIGIEGKKLKVNGRNARRLLFLPRWRARFEPGHRTAGRLPLPRQEVPEAIERLLRRYLLERNQTKTCASSSRATATKSCADYWLASR